MRPVRRGIRNPSGFSFIELAVVIAILGMLAVVALLKFFDIRDAAEQNAVKAVHASIETSIRLLHTRYVLTGQPYSVQDVIDNISFNGVEVTVENL